MAHRQIRHAVTDIEAQSAAAQLQAAVAHLDRQIQRVLDILLDETMPRPEVELRGRLAALEGERRLVLERLQRVEATVLTQAQAAAQAAVQEAHLRGVLGALPTRMASMSPAERATLLRACVDEIVVQSDGMLTITGVLPSAEAIQPTVELSPGCRSRRQFHGLPSDSFPDTLTCQPMVAGRDGGHRPRG